jgi:predicted Zn-ribbon and HTH transcriptional regulator
MVEERRGIFRNFFRRKTPTPSDRKVYNFGIQERDTTIWMSTPIIYHIASSSVILRTCITQLKNEVFRRGVLLERKFAVKCEDCGHEHEKPAVKCAECESTNLRKPDFKQKKYAQSLLFDRYVNSSEQLFIDVLKELEDDLNIMDDAYIILVKEYYVDGNSNIRLQRIKEMYRGDPATMHIYSDEEGDRGTMGFTCLHHRDFKSEDEHSNCEVCGSKLYPIHYVNRVNGNEQFFIEGEVLHFSKYSPSRLYGQSPVITLFNHITTLIAMEQYVNSSYTKSRMPKGLLAVQTRNIESMKTFWRAVKEKMESDPHFIPVMGIEAEGGKGSVEWIKFMDSLKEMDYVAVKEDLRDRIAAFYGVSKIFMADNSTSGGLNNEGMQILVTNRAVEMAQNVYNNYVFPFLTRQFCITDWVLKLPPSEEEDEIAVLRKREIEVNIAASTKNLGFEVDMDENGEFVFTKPEPKEPAQGEQKEGGEEQVELDPYAGTDVDASQLGQMQEQMMAGGAGGDIRQSEGATRNKPSMSVGPPNRNTGLPAEAANNNVDRRTERRVG